MQKSIILGDIHFPWACQKSLSKAIAIIRKVQPTYVVQIGDLFDFFAFTRFPRSHDIMTPGVELQSGRRQAVKLWKDIRQAAPKAECYQLKGNHCMRLFKRIKEVLPEIESLADKFDALWAFDGVSTQPSDRHELILDGVCYMHGFRQTGEHVKYNLMSTVVGHHHTGGVVYHRQRDKTLWELNAGYLADYRAPVMSYGQQMKFSRWTPGIGLIDDYGPRFIPF